MGDQPTRLRPCDLAWQAFQYGISSRLDASVLLTEAGTIAANAEFMRWWNEMRELGHKGDCAKCGYDPHALITGRWELVVARDPPSLNARLSNSGDRAFLYRRERDAWTWEFRAARLRDRIPKASRRRRATLTRMYAGRQQERDRDNLAGGMKCVVDAMVLEGLLADDSPTLAEIHYAEQRVGDKKLAGLRLVLEDLA